MNYSDLNALILTYLGFHGMGKRGDGGAHFGSAAAHRAGGTLPPAARGALRRSLVFAERTLPELSFGVFFRRSRSRDAGRGGRSSHPQDLQRGHGGGVVADACASALLETLADEAEEALEKERTYRFCPGYGGSDISDVKYILEAVRGERIGITVQQSGLMLPQKTMAGFVGIGKTAQKSCAGCILGEHCAYRKEGRVCYAK